MWNMISSPATPTVCVGQKSENFHKKSQRDIIDSDTISKIIIMVFEIICNVTYKCQGHTVRLWCWPLTCNLESVIHWDRFWHVYPIDDVIMFQIYKKRIFIPEFRQDMEKYLQLPPHERPGFIFMNSGTVNFSCKLFFRYVLMFLWLKLV